jgi:hypothetical protein
MRTEDIIYICVKLDNESKVKLKNIVDEMFADDYAKLFCDHLTLAFGRECELFDMDLLGSEVKIVADTVAYDDKIAALVVDRNQVEELGVNNEHPHITLVTFDGSTRPVYSNQMLASDDYELVEFVEDKIELKGHVLAVTKNPVPQK